MPPGGGYIVALNTDGSDLRPTLWKGRVVFASDTSIDIKKKTDRWTGGITTISLVYRVTMVNVGQT